MPTRPQAIANAGRRAVGGMRTRIGRRPALLATIAILVLTGLGIANWKLYLAQRHLVSAVGELRQEQQAYFHALGQAVGKLRAEQETRGEQSEGLLRDLDSSAASLRHNLDALTSRLGVHHSPKDIVIAALDDYEALGQHGDGFRDASGRTPMPCAPTRNSAVIVTLGQSNAANHALAPYAAKRDVLNFDFYDGKCYRARDPLLGASGTGGNFATPLADMLIERGLYDRIVIAPIAIGGSTVEEWADEGRFNRRILVLIRRLFDAGIEPTYILWHQGEGNSGEGDARGRQYTKNLLDVVSTFRRYGISAPFFVALATTCGPQPHPSAQNIREGQQAAANPLMNVFLGPDTDTLGPEYRDAQNCHFNAAGLQRHAALWADVLQGWAAANPARN